MSYVDRPRDDDAALNIDDQRCADYTESHRYRMRAVPFAFSSVNDSWRVVEKKKGGRGGKMYTGKVTALSANYRESRLK